MASLKAFELRALVPTWFFFDELGAGCQVFVRSGIHVKDLGPWQVAFPPTPRKAWQLFFNPDGNFRLFALANFERLLREAQFHLSNPEALEGSESYDHCRSLLRESGLPKSHRFAQFKICARLEGDPTAEFSDALVSRVHEI